MDESEATEEVEAPAGYDLGKFGEGRYFLTPREDGSWALAEDWVEGREVE